MRIMRSKAKIRTQSGVLAGVVDVMVIILVTTCLMFLILNVGRIMYYKIKLGGIASIAVDVGRDESMISTDFPTSSYAHQRMADTVDFLVDKYQLVGKGRKVSLKIDTNARVASVPAIVVTATTPDVPMVGPFAPISVSDTEVTTYRRTIDHIGFQTIARKANPVFHPGSVFTPGHKGGNPVLWVPVLEHPEAGPNLPPTIYTLQSTYASTIAPSCTGSNSNDHHSGIPPQKALPLQHLVFVFRPPRGGNWVHVPLSEVPDLIYSHSYAGPNYESVLPDLDSCKSNRTFN